MGIDIKFKHGIWIGVPYMISIPNDAEFWNMTPADAFNALLEARESQKYAADLCWLDGAYVDEPTRLHGSRREVFTALKRIDKNIFVDDEDKEFYKECLKRYDEYLSEKALKRQPNTTLRKKIIARDESKCRYCGCDATGIIHIDHIIPYSLGGRTEKENLVVACKICNLRKTGKTLKEAGMRLLKSS